MNALYEEFLNHHGLNNGLIYHVVLPHERIFKDVPKLSFVRFGNHKVFVNESVNNAVAFSKQIHLAQMNADQSLRQWVKLFLGYRLDYDDIERLCQNLENGILEKLLFPFQLICEEENFTREKFEPIAYEMEKIVLDVFYILDTFYDAMIQTETSIRQKADQKIAQLNRQTDAWAANAPVRVRGSARVVGERIHVYATAESTVTSGMVAADYQVHALMENTYANREIQMAQKDLLKMMHDDLLKVIKNYVIVWKNCVEKNKNSFRTIYSPAIYSSKPLALPNYKKHAQSILHSLLKSEEDFFGMNYYLRFYHFDLDELYGDNLARKMINQCVKDQKADVNNVHYLFYCQFYEVEAAVEYEPFFKHVKKVIKEMVQLEIDRVVKNNMEKYKNMHADQALLPFFKLIDMIPGLSHKKHMEIVDACRYIYYDAIGDTSLRDVYDEKNPMPTFDYDWNKK